MTYSLDSAAVRADAVRALITVVRANVDSLFPTFACVAFRTTGSHRVAGYHILCYYWILPGGVSVVSARRALCVTATVAVQVLWVVQRRRAGAESVKRLPAPSSSSKRVAVVARVLARSAMRAYGSTVPVTNSSPILPFCCGDGSRVLCRFARRLLVRKLVACGRAVTY